MLVRPLASCSHVSLKQKKFSLSEKFVGEMCGFYAGGDWYKVPLDGGLASRVFAICFVDSEI